jgi:hypothetical protein
MAGRLGLEGTREVGSQSGERRRGGTSVTGRGSSSTGQLKGEPAALGWPVVVASVSLEVGDGGSRPGGRVVRRRPGRGGGYLGRPAGQGPGRGGGGLWLGLGEGGGPREEEGEASRPNAKAQEARPKTKAGPNLRNKTFSNFIWNSDFWQTLEICIRRSRRDFDMKFFPKIF